MDDPPTAPRDRVEPADGQQRVTVLAPACRSERIAIGPTAWFVLEELALQAGPAGDGVLLAHTSVRTLAANTGLSKDTVAAALRRLVDRRVVRRVDHRDSTTGRFGRSTYLLDLVGTGLSLPCTDLPDTVKSDTAKSDPVIDDPAGEKGPERERAPTRTRSSRPARRVATAGESVTAQLSLLELPTTATTGRHPRAAIASTAPTARPTPPPRSYAERRTNADVTAHISRATRCTATTGH